MPGDLWLFWMEREDKQEVPAKHDMYTGDLFETNHQEKMNINQPHWTHTPGHSPPTHP